MERARSLRTNILLALPLAALILALAVSAAHGHAAVVSGGSPGDEAAGARPLVHTVGAAIEAAHASGRIGFDDMILLKAIALYDHKRLPEEYAGRTIDKCGTHIAREIDAALPELSPQVAERIRQMRARPSCDAFYDTPHFRINYDTSGPHMILGWPDTSYRDAIAVALEFCWSEEVDTLGFRPPPGDGSDPDGGGGSAHYDVYLQSLSGVFGYCQGSYTVPATPRTDCTSYVVIDNDYAGFGYPDPTDPMKVTVAHEFCHSCQFSHDYNEPTWYMECTSVWVEDILYDSIDDYRGYIFYYYNYPYASLEWNDPTGLRMYGSCVWNFFLTEHIDVGVVPAIWYQCENPGDTYLMMDTVLGTYGTTLEDEFNTYAVWNWFTGTRADTNHYEEGAWWPLVAAQRTYSSYPVIGGAPMAEHQPDHMAFNFMHLNNPGGSEDLLDITYDGPSPLTTTNYAFVNTRSSRSTTAEYGEIVLNGFGNGSVTVTGWDGLSQACVVVVNASLSVDDMPYTIDADRATPVEGTVYAVAEPASVVLRWTLPHPELMISLDVERAVSSDGEFHPLNTEPLSVTTPGSFVDTDVRPGDRLWYRLMATLSDGTRDIVQPGVIFVSVDGSMDLALSRPSPNPFIESTTVEFAVPSAASRVALRIYDVNGRLIREIEQAWLGQGRYVRSWDGKNDGGRRVAAGVYLCSLEVNGQRRTQKAMLLK